jgi:autophagy-related protein 9
MAGPSSSNGMAELGSPNRTQTNYHLFQDGDDILYQPPDLESLINVENLERVKEKEKESQEFDTFISKIYLYYLHQGFGPILLGELVNILIFVFIVGLMIFLTSFVSYRKMLSVEDETPISAFFDFSIRNIPILIWILSSLMLIFWGLNIFQLILDFPDLIKIRNYYRDVLKIDNVAITDWNTVIDRMFESRNPYTFEDRAGLPLFLASRIMRKENYLIAAFNRNLFASSFIPWLDLNIQYTKSVEWALNYAVWNYIFENNSVRPDLLNPGFRPFFVKQLRRRMIFFGVALFILSPIIFLYLLIYYSCSYFDQIRASPSILGGRIWSRHALWKFREFNELSHYFSDRIAKSRKPASLYINSFPSYLMSHLAHLVGFVIGAFLIVILIWGFFSDNILIQITVFGRSLLYFAGIFGLILTVTSSMSVTDLIKGDSQLYLDQVASHIHYRPSSWNVATSPEVMQDVKSLFSYRIGIFFSSILGILIGPFWLIFSLPKYADDILQFIQEFTQYDSQLGYVCSLSSFDQLNKHGNPKYGAPLRSLAEKNGANGTKNGKMEKSIITFAQNHPQWVPPADCQEMIRDIRDYLVSSSMSMSKGKSSIHLALSQFRQERRSPV